MKLWFVLGVFFLGTAVLGIVLPVLPTTPLVLVAAGCFAKSSPKTYNWLLESEQFGPTIKNWEANRCIPLRIKWIAVSMIALVGGSSVLFFVPMGWPKFASLALLIYGAWYVLHQSTCSD
ncbi:MAG: YbaN family protein [Ardenticatenaceae bacterium]|nr:YbaN family protein [Anaerolineales bacterium]MCB8941565.1 YbaN family protein [Ardenticatenaceae bacterium]MCB8974541.1 YbaN family protein [Ardenticatenaceae bacterium]